MLFLVLVFVLNFNLFEFSAAILEKALFLNFLLGRLSESRSHSYFAVHELDIAVRELDIALGNHALRAQPRDYSLICRYRLVNNL